MKLDVAKYPSRFGWRNRLARVAWGVVWTMLFRPSPRIFFGWRSFLLRCFGARIGRACAVYPSCKVWAPWNLELGEWVALADQVECYCVDKIVLGSHVTVSQYSYLCTASHDITSPHMRLITAPITAGEGAWICAGAFIAPGVTLGEGAVAAARAVVVKDVPPWTVVGGNPACFLKHRQLKEPPSCAVA